MHCTLPRNAFALRERRHHQQRVTEDHPVRPVALVVVVALGRVLLPAFGQAVEVVEEVELGSGILGRSLVCRRKSSMMRRGWIFSWM